MDAQCQESAVALKHFQNIADFDVVCTALGIDNIEVAFFRPEIVEEAQNHTNQCQNGDSDTIALGIVTEHGDNDGEQHRSQNTKIVEQIPRAEESWARSSSVFAMADSREPMGMFSMV